VVNTELSKVKDGSVLESQQYLPEQEDLRPVQADVFQDVIQSLKIELDVRQAADARRPLTSDFAAFQAFLRGETVARGTDAEDMHAAILDYEEAVRRDPNFGLAWHLRITICCSGSTLSRHGNICRSHAGMRSGRSRSTAACARRTARWV
jgi:hypothetical protein